MLSADPLEAYLHYAVQQAFQIENQCLINTKPLYRCRMNGTNYHFTSTDPGCERNIYEFQLGYVRTSQSVNTPVALYRCWDGHGDHMDSMHPLIECFNGYTIERI